MSSLVSLGCAAVRTFSLPESFLPRDIQIVMESACARCTCCMKIESGKTALEKKYIETSNVTHFENIVTGVGRFPGVQAIFHTFSILDVDSDVTLKHTVDIVAKNGDQWMANLFQRNFSAPEVVFEFIAGIPDAIALKLRSMGVRVIGKEVPIDSITKVPDDFLEILVENGNKNEPNTSNQSVVCEQDLPPVNLDVSAVFVLISNLTHENGTNHKFDSTLLAQQAEMELRSPARQLLLEQIEGREWIICRTAYNSVRDILSTVGGPTEKKRMDQLFKTVRIVDDAKSDRTALLKHSERINQRSMGVSFDVILHESRALSEQKELPLG
uniref:SAM-dependent methyltransferase n=1 Tax=Heterorhabditis bacteriophora TaxID=37862 RepID=A0A1I7XTP0_HETBA